LARANRQGKQEKTIERLEIARISTVPALMLSFVCHLFLEQDELYLPSVLGQFFVFFECVFELCLARADCGFEARVQRGVYVMVEMP